MPKGSKQKYKLYYLARIMLESTDEEHYISIREIMDALSSYGVTADRRTLYNDLKDLEILGIEIEGEPVGNRYHYHVIGRPFELAELKLLVDAIQASRFITARKSEDLIKKLASFVSRYEEQGLRRQVFVSGRVKTMNESIYYSVDAVHNAISENKKISFQYYQWNRQGRQEARHNGAFYVVSPWGLSWDNENYYLVAFDSEAGKIKHYRVDKMKQIGMVDEDREGREYFRQFDMAEYSKKNFGMFGGQEYEVKLLVANELAGVIIDRFGRDLIMIPEDEAHFTVNVKVYVSNQFLHWVFALGEGAVIIGPPEVRRMAEEEIRRISRQYHKAI